VIMDRRNQTRIGLSCRGIEGTETVPEKMAQYVRYLTGIAGRSSR
jgi:hypothetical protein